MRLPPALMVLLTACLPHSSGQRGRKHMASMDTGEGLPGSFDQEQDIGNPMTGESLPVLGKSLVASHGMNPIASMDTGEGMSRSIGQEQTIGNPLTDEALPVLGKQTVAGHGHHPHKKGVARKHHLSHRRHHTGRGELEDRSTGLEESTMRSKEPKECKYSAFPLRRRRHGKFSRKKSMTRRCMKHCMKERRKHWCHREPCHMEIALPFS